MYIVATHYEQLREFKFLLFTKLTEIKMFDVLKQCNKVRLCYNPSIRINIRESSGLLRPTYLGSIYSNHGGRQQPAEATQKPTGKEYALIY